MGKKYIEAIRDIVEKDFRTMVDIRRRLHAYPEVSGEEKETTKLISKLMKTEQLDFRLGSNDLGVIADFRYRANDQQKQLGIAIRGDIDALYIQDLKKTSYHSTYKGIMHACGHDAHTVIIYEAIKVIKNVVERGYVNFPVHVRAIFQPSEETGKGAIQMIKDDALKNITSILSLHVDPTLDVGTIGLRSNVFTANCDSIHIDIRGQGGHAARPHESFDPIAAAAQLISSIYLFIPRAMNHLDPVVITIGMIHGGQNPNVIPEKVELKGTLRTLEHDTRKKVIQHLKKLSYGIAQTSDTHINLNVHSVCQSVLNDPKIVGIIRDAAQMNLGPNSFLHIPKISMGGEDFGFYGTHVPSAMFRLGSGSNRIERASLHSSYFDIDEESLKVGARILSTSVLLLLDPDHQTQAYF